MEKMYKSFLIDSKLKDEALVSLDDGLSKEVGTIMGDFLPALDYFLKIIRYETDSDDSTGMMPSTQGQLLLLADLQKELEALGLTTIFDNRGIVYGHLQASKGFEDLPALGLLAHVDTSPEYTGKDVKPQILKYKGEDLVLNAKTRANNLEEEPLLLGERRFSAMKKLRDHLLVCTDGSTLLGADDKAGIAAILGLLYYIKENPGFQHGKICVAFTSDEEIGCGVTPFDTELFGAYYAYTIDGGEEGEFEAENFNAASADINFKGLSVHTGTAKGRMINAALLAARFVASLDFLDTAEHTENREGFTQLITSSGDISSAKLHYIIRDFEIDGFVHRKAKLRSQLAAFNEQVRLEYPWVDFDVAEIEIKDQYFNMRDKVQERPEVLALARQAIEAAGVKIQEYPIRGGTDGAGLTQKGLPCPNIFTGGGNFHGRYEYLSINSFSALCKVVLELCIGQVLFGNDAKVPKRAGKNTSGTLQERLDTAWSLD